MGQWIVPPPFWVNDEGKKFDGVPQQVTHEAREMLGIFEKEETVRSPAVISLDQPNTYSKYNFPVFRDYIDLSKEKNYETIPPNVISHIFLFLRPSDFLSIFLSCQYFYKSSSSNLLWKRYYESFFEMTEEEKENLELNLNFKKQFFKRFSDCRNADLFYRKRHRPIFISEMDKTGVHEMLTSNGDFYSLDESDSYVICGPRNVGKRTLLHCLWKEEYIQKIECEDECIHFHAQRPSLRVMNNEIIGVGRQFHRIIVRSEMKNEQNIQYHLRSDTVSSSFIFCFVAGDRKSFEEVKEFVKFYSKCFCQRVPDKQRVRGILCGMKSDLRKDGEKDQVSIGEVRKLINDHMLKGYVECSSKENSSVYLPFGILVEKRCWRLRRVAL